MNTREFAVAAVEKVAEGSGYAWAWGVSAFKWTLAPLCDSWDGLSLNRFLAIAFGIAAVHGRLFHDASITAMDNVLAAIAGSLAFGKDVWIAWLEHKKDT